MARPQAPAFPAPLTPPRLHRDTFAAFLSRNGLLIAGLGALVSFWMLVYALVAFHPQFAAKSTVIIKDSAITSRYVEPDQYYALQTTSSSSSNPVLNTMGILKSQPISQALWEDFRQRRPRELERLKIKTQADWNAFYQDGSSFIKAKNQAGTDLITIQFTWTDPVIARDALIVVDKAFQEASRELNQAEQISRTHFLGKQVADLEAELAAVRKQKSDFQSAQGTVSTTKESEGLAVTRLELDGKINELEAKARGRENLVRRYQQLLRMPPEKALTAAALGQNASMGKLQDELYRLEQHYAMLNTSLTPNNPKVQEVASQIEQVKANIAAETSRTVGENGAESGDVGVVADATRNTLVGDMLKAQGEAQAFRAEKSVLLARRDAIGQNITAFPGMAENLAAIEQKEASLSVALDHLRQKVMEGKLKEAQTLSNVFVVDPPRLPEKPQFPARNHLIILSLLLGAGVGVAGALAKEQLWPPANREDQDDRLTQEPGHTPRLAPLPPAHVNGNGNGKAQVQDKGSPAVNAGRVASESETLHRELLLSELEAAPQKPLVAGLAYEDILPLAGPMARRGQRAPQRVSRPAPGPFSAQPAPLETVDAAPDLAPPPIVFPEPYDLPELKENTEAFWAQYFEHNAVSPADAESVSSEISELLEQPAHAPLEAVTPEGIMVSGLTESATEATPALTLADFQSAEYQSPAAPPTVSLARTPEVIAPAAAPPDLLKPDADDRLRTALMTGAVVDVASANEAPATLAQEPEGYSAHAALPDEPALHAMPLPTRKKRRSLPAFLLNGPADAPVETARLKPDQPYTLIPRKQLLSAEEDLLAPVVPLSAPAPEALLAAERLAFPPAMPHADQFQAPRAPLKNLLKLGKKPAQRPEAFFGLGARKQKSAEPPASLGRLMGRLGRNDY